MQGAASILFWRAAVRRPQAWCARCSGTLVWARPMAATAAGAGGWGRWGARCAGQSITVQGEHPEISALQGPARTSAGELSAWDA